MNTPKDDGAAALPTAQLAVNRNDLVSGLKHIKKFAKVRASQDAILTYQQGQLFIAVGGVEIAAVAVGQWAGEGRVPLHWIFALPEVVDPAETMELVVRGGFLRCGIISAPCKWLDAREVQVQLPVGAGILDILRTARGHDDQTLEASGILRQVNEARVKRDELITRAAKTLRPLGLDEQRLHWLVEERLRSLSEGGRVPSE